MLLRVVGASRVVRALLATYNLSFTVVFEDADSIVANVADAPWYATQGLNTKLCTAIFIPRN